MYALRALLRLIMLDRRRTFGGDVLHERSPERDVGDLDAPADRQRRQTPFVRQAHERQLILVARAMRRVGFRADGGAVLRRSDVLVRMKGTLVQAKLGVDDLRDGLAQSRRKLEVERRELSTVRRRKELAVGIQDAETVQIAERFERQHEERARVLEEKIDIQTR